MDYERFRIDIRSVDAEDRFEATVTTSPLQTDARHRFDKPLDEVTLEGLCGAADGAVGRGRAEGAETASRSDTPELPSPRQVGTRLAEALLGGEIGTLLRRSRVPRLLYA